MKHGQYYEPLSKSSSADVLIRLNDDSILHIQFKNTQDPISKNKVQEEIEKCNVPGWANYCVIVCTSGHSISDVDECLSFGNGKCIILSKKSVEAFFGRHALDHLSSQHFR